MLLNLLIVTIITAMEITKAYWSSNEGRVSLSMPITKVNEEARTVSGFASVDNLDEHGDIITAECAYDAFKRFRGNLREMHQHIAVGKVVDFDQKPVYDAESDKIYSGVYVTAYISTGAQDTWEKVVDGTLNGFSIGGNLVDSEDIFDKEIGHPVRVVTKMDLHELSLVDNPANQLANVVSIQKLNDSSIATGLAVDVETENVFWCEKNQISILSKDEDLPSCPECDSAMENIGWIESGANKSEKMKRVVNSHIIKNSEKGGVDNMTDVNEEAVEQPETEAAEEVVSEVIEEAVSEDSVIDASESVEEVISEDVAAEVSEETVSEEDVDEIVADTSEEEVEQLPSFDAEALIAELRAELASMKDFVSEAVGTVAKSVSSTLDETKQAVEAVKSELSEFQSQFSEVSKRVDLVVKETAVKKSGELGREPDQIKKGLWSGKFLSAEEL